MENHFLVSFGSAWWWAGWLILAVYFTTVFLIGRSLKEKARLSFEKTWGLLIAGALLYTQAYQFLNGSWSVSESLPSHLCGFSGLLSIALLYFRKKWAFVPLFFWGIVGGFHSLMTPESTLGGDSFFLIEYYFSHASIMVVPVYHVFVNGVRIPRKGWLTAFLLNNALLPIVFIINHFTGGNYMYLTERPLVDNPFVVGEWPWYIVGFELAGILQYGILRLLFWNKLESK